MPDILLKNVSGEDVTYENVNSLSLRSTDGGTETFVSENLIQTQIQADWNQTDEAAVDYIKNKPETFEAEAELPEVTSEDDGKVLGVLNGEWSKINVDSGGSDGVSSWNDLADKPFYTDGKWNELVSETALTFTLVDGMSQFSTTPTIEMLEMYDSEWGKALVLWDGIEYECEPKSYYGIKAIGNVEFVNGTGNSEEPFAILVDDGTLAGSPLSIIVSIVDSSNETETATHTIEIKFLIEKIYPLDSKFINDVSWSKISDKPFYEASSGTVVVDENVTI